MNPDRPFAEGRRVAVLVLHELKADAGRLTQSWLARVRALDGAGWATHAVILGKDRDLPRTVRGLVAGGELPEATQVHHYVHRDRRVRASWWGPLPEGQTTDDRIADWLDWLTGQVPGAVVMADSPTTYPPVARMTNPLVARVAVLNLNHLGTDAADAHGPMTKRFAERFEPIQEQFDSLVVMTAAQARDLRDRFGQDTPVSVIPPAVAAPADHALDPSGQPGRTIVSVGPLEPGSGHDLVLAAAATVLPKYPDARLEIIGTGAHEAELREQAASLGIDDRMGIHPPGQDPYDPWRNARVTAWVHSRDAAPLAMIRSLAAGVPVVARDVRYGPKEYLTSPALGELVSDEAGLAGALDRRLAAPADPDEVRASAQALLRRTDPSAVGARWVALATEAADSACDHRKPSLLGESVTTTSRVIRIPAVLADASGDLGSWTCELPGLVEPAGWIVPATAAATTDDSTEDDPPIHPHAAGPTREVAVQLRSNALAFVAEKGDAEFAVTFTNGEANAALQTVAFPDRIIASRIGNAIVHHRADGSVWVRPLRELLYASNVEGRLVVRTQDDTPSDITHAIDWAVDLDWSDLGATARGARFHGTLRATAIAPAEDSPPAICVSDVGGFSRIVGQLHYVGRPTVDGLEWSCEVEGVLEVEPLVATTQLARGALSLHVGFRGLLVPVGGVWTRGSRAALQLSCDRGEVTLLLSPGGRLLAAPGKGIRARLSGAVRSVVLRG